WLWCRKARPCSQPYRWADGRRGAGLVIGADQCSSPTPGDRRRRAALVASDRKARPAAETLLLTQGDHDDNRVWADLPGYFKPRPVRRQAGAGLLRRHL